MKQLLTVTIWLTATTALADASFYKSNEFSCNGVDRARIEMSIENKGDINSVSLFTMDLDDRKSYGGNFSLSDAQLSEGIYLQNTGGSFDVALERAGDELKPIIVNRNGVPEKNCVGISFETVGSAMSRYEVVSTMYQTPAKTIEEYLATNSAFNDRPPAGLLPDLDQVQMNEKMIEGLTEYRTAFQDYTLAQSLTDEGVSQVKMIGNMIYKAPDRESQEMMTDVVMEASLNQAINLGDPKEAQTKMALKSEELCGRINNWGTTSFNDNNRYIFFTNVPSFLWDKDFAQKTIDDASLCESEKKYGQRFADKIKKSWPKIESGNAIYSDLITKIETEIAQQPTLASLNEAEWMDYWDGNNMYESGLSEDVINELIVSKVTAAWPSLLEDVSKEWIDQGLSETDIDKYPSYCNGMNETRRGFGFMMKNARTLLGEALKTCNNLVANKFESTAKSEIDKIANAMEKTPSNFEEAIAIVSTSIPQTRGIMDKESAFGKAEIQIAEYHKSTIPEELVASRTQEARDIISAQIIKLDKEEVKADSNLDELKTMCESIQSNRALRDIGNQCVASYNNKFAQQRDLVCSSKFKSAKVPDEIMNGTVIINSFFSGKQAIEIKKIVCDQIVRDNEITIEKAGGIFSKSYQLIANAGNGSSLTVEIISDDSEQGAYAFKHVSHEPKSASLEFLATADNSMLFNCLREMEACEFMGMN